MISCLLNRQILTIFCKANVQKYPFWILFFYLDLLKRISLTTTLFNNEITASIHHIGAELISLKNNSEREFIWEGNPEFWGKHSPVLFPIVGTLKNNQYQHKNKTYSLSRHGFAREMEFQLIEKSDNTATFSLVSNIETLKIYPFDFEFRIIYTLEKNQLKIGYGVYNKGKDSMFFSVGAHPAFALPLPFEDYSIEVEKDEILTYHLLESDLISNTTQAVATENKKFRLNYPLFEKDALIFKSLQSESLTIFEKDKALLKIEFNDFPNLGIWTKNNAPFICIEPWFGYSDSVESNGRLSEKEGIQSLNANGIFNCAFTINVL